MLKNILLFLLLSVSLTFAQDKSIILSVDKSTLSIGETTILNISLLNIKSSEQPQIENLGNFTVNYRGTSSKVSIVNGDYKAEKIYSYIIRAEKEGNFTIGPAIVKVGNKTLRSNTIDIKVTKNKIDNRNQEDKNIFIKVSPTKNSVYLNQEIILSVRLYRRLNTYDIRMNIPAINEFIIEKLTDVKEFYEIINNKKYLVSEIKYALYPTQTGVFTIPPFVIQCNLESNENIIDNFFKNPFAIANTREVSIQSNPTNIEVKPFSKPIYAVGNYTFKYNIDKSKIKIGESATITFTINGEGNLNLSDKLTLSEVIGLRYYPDKPKVTISKTENGVLSEKTEKIVVISEKEGTFKISAKPIIFYNPTTEKYHEINLPAINIDVKGGNDDNLKIVEKSTKREIASQGEYLDTIFTNFKLEEQGIKLNYKFAIIYFLPILIFALVIILKIYLNTRRDSYYTVLKNNAFHNFKKSIDSISTIEELSDSVKVYFTNKTGNFDKQATFEEIIKILHSQNLPQEQLSTLETIFCEMDKAKFSKRNDININQLKRELFEIIKSINSEHLKH